VATRDGEWASTSVGDSFLYVSPSDPRLVTYGSRPHRRSVIQLPAPVALRSVALPQELNVVDQLYEYGKIIRQDERRGGVVAFFDFFVFDHRRRADARAVV